MLICLPPRIKQASITETTNSTFGRGSPPNQLKQKGNILKHIATKKKCGKPRIGKEVMTNADLQRRQRAKPGKKQLSALISVEAREILGSLSDETGKSLAFLVDEIIKAHVK